MSAVPTSIAPAPQAPVAPAASRAELSHWLLVQARPVLAPLVVSTAFRIAFLLLAGALLGWAVFGVVAEGRESGSLAVGRFVLVLVVIALVKALTRYLEQFIGHLVAFKALARLRVAFYTRLEPQAPAAVEGRRTGDLLSRATRDVDRVEVFYAHTLAPLMAAIVVPVIVAVWLAAQVGPAAAGAAIAGWLLIAAVATLGARDSLGAAARLRVQRGELAQQVTDSVQGVREVLAFGAEGTRLDALAGAGADVAASSGRIARWVALRRGLVAGLTLATPLAVLVVASAGEAPWWWAVTATAVVAATMPAVLALEEAAADLDQAFASAARVRAITEAPPATPQSAAPVAPPAAPVAVRLEGVSFAYPRLGDERSGGPGVVLGPEVLHDLSLDLPAGTMTALVGASGSGKSTVASLVARSWDPGAGRVRFGDVDARDLADADLRRLVGVVSQRPFLLNDTVAANLRLAAPEASDAELLSACARAALDVADLSDGLATRVGEQGERLSGGQRQRVAIARALLRDAPVLILDEVTSQLDRATERDLAAALAEVVVGRTVLLIAHRLATVRDADRIVVMDAGRVVEQGDHATLLAAGGAYAELLARETEPEEA